MKKIGIVSSSVRTGRKSHHVALYFRNYIREHALAETDLIDLNVYNFPLFDERLRFQTNPSPDAVQFSERIRSCTGIVIVSPEYNGGIPASLKNAIDLLYEEWRKKPVAIVTASSGPFGGSQVLISLQFSLWKIGALTVPALFPVADVEHSFDEKGRPADKDATDKRAARFIGELLWLMEVLRKVEP